MDRKYLLKSSIRTATLSRVIAKAIDLFIVLIISILLYPFSLLIGLLYISFADSLYGGQSVGKKIIGFSVISLEDGKPCSAKQSVIRNLPIIIPLSFAIIPPWGILFCVLLLIPLMILELYLLFKLDSGHRLGDVMADTTVCGNDPNRVDIRKNHQSWFSNNKNMSTANKQSI